MAWRARVLSVFLVFGFWSAACGGDPPAKELQEAQTAIAAARAAGANHYAVEEFTAAEEALKNANLAVDQRDYRLALNDALDSRERAENAARQAADGMAAAKAAADRALSDAAMAQSNAAVKMKAAQTAHVPAHSLDEARTKATDADQRLQEARTAFAAGDYTGAEKAAAAAHETFTRAVDDIEAATGSPSARRRR